MRHGNFEFLWHIFFLAVCSKIPLADLRSGFSVVLRASIFPLGTLAVRKLGRHVERPKTNLNSQKNTGGSINGIQWGYPYTHTHIYMYIYIYIIDLIGMDKGYPHGLETSIYDMMRF